ncbi:MULTISPECIES: MazG nucleotide pyrophosphohydrolase domain-containing protein [Mammaliicoccus]|mgnify:CR=1 FL=1|uniref:Nucleotide pyrophosphohydrolase n=1 Tax=Mammaliicoccus vitulinus TaxID=71237 RepID=A0ABX7HI97_9STAP|nr:MULTISPECIES: MazG nucleotide pyrophosphohydrolase domain-containing protein [Mammaliicoccus]PNZ38043.1 nucleotide pyrophosphohydrolase [Mammaliicoccus vitulinus]PTI37165.1 nucleotide pyrophosphohydrolase [Mammaliicoccus vitulinus]PTI70803.1 nucleotide pyrophosphohydrolase [Mammaliicoccus vitulinus]PTI90319.1 nucleotide pyrophosphohydrolase [Mammaliicoccus vitulinus]QQT15192.1 nucleotide pyrophosphohydrolase [Mammaliicoccus vitulinus]
MAQQIVVVGLGNYSIDELPMGVYRKLQSVDTVYARTLEHPVINELKDINWKSFDSVYEKHDDFINVYTEIVDTLIEKAETEDVIYAVPGDPSVAETTTQLLLEKFPNVKILGGKSFLDDMFRAVNIDPNDGFTLLDGTNLSETTLNVRTNTIITQVYDQLVASDIKVTLMERYPDEHEVMIVSNARLGEADVITCPLYEMDHHAELSNLTSLFVPKILEEHQMYNDFQYLEHTIDTLVSEDGCPWDKVQTHDSLKRYIIEEAFELIEAIDEEDIDHMVEELGDILLQVMLHASIGKKEGFFDVREVVQELTSKMIRRHPHVFSDQEANDIEDLNRIWQSEKIKEGKVEREKLEKIFADYFLKLYDKTKLEGLGEDGLKEFINKGDLTI